MRQFSCTKCFSTGTTCKWLLTCTDFISVCDCYAFSSAYDDLLFSCTSGNLYGQTTPPSTTIAKTPCRLPSPSTLTVPSLFSYLPTSLTLFLRATALPFHAPTPWMILHSLSTPTCSPVTHSSHFTCIYGCC
jgi:hypothetical protein